MEYVDGGVILTPEELEAIPTLDASTRILTDVDEPAPTGYSPASHQTIPGADWYIGGQRYRETSRTPTEGGYAMTLELAEVPDLLGYTIEQPEF